MRAAHVGRLGTPFVLFAATSATATSTTTTEIGLRSASKTKRIQRASLGLLQKWIQIARSRRHRQQ